MSYYSAARARRSLWQFLLGKLLAALAGLAWLIWLVRSAEPAQYGAYVAAMALVEIFYLATGMGLSTRAQRYVAEWRIRARPPAFRRFVMRLLAQRLLFAAIGAGLLAIGLPALLGALGLHLSPAARVALLLWLVAGSLTRQLDEVFPALLLQGASQALSLGANLLRLLAALLWTLQASHPSVEGLLMLEAGAALLLGALGLLLLARALRDAQADPGATDEHDNPARPAVERRLYLVQLLGQAWSGNTARLLVTQLAGAAQAAALGFAGSLAETLRNYLPAYLLAHWLRPLMVARWSQSRQMAPLALIANAVLKLSLLVLAPLLAYLPLRGDELAAWLSGGRYGPGMAALFGALMLWLLLQCAHVLLSIVTATVERTRANLAATALGCMFLPAAWLCGERGASTVVLLLCIAEVLWIGLVGLALARAGLALRWQLAGLLKLAAAVGLSAAALMLLPPLPGAATLAALALSAALVLLVAMLLKPLNGEERELLATVLPRRWLMI